MNGKWVIKAATAGFGGLGGAIIGTAICPGIGALTIGIVSGLGG